jgi:dihydrofolate synthase/folylpolyglutamate synthase
LNAEILKEKADRFGLKGNIYADVNTAIKAALAKSNKNDLVLVCGSVFLVGEVNAET